MASMTTAPEASTPRCEPCEESTPAASARPFRSRSHCWVCASREDVVPEPGLHRKIAHLAHDGLLVPVGVVVGSCLALPILLHALVNRPSVVEAASAASPSDPQPILSVASTILALCGTLATVCIWNAVSIPNDQLSRPVERPAPCDAAELSRLAELLAGAIRIPTVSHDKNNPDGTVTDTKQFLNLHAYLRDAFPLVHKHLRVEVVNQFSLLYEWRGSEPSLPPVMLCAHLDVVPAPHEASNPWTHPPFAGVIDDEQVVWGRGAIDNKHNVVTQLDVIEGLLRRGVVPRRTLFLACGHDEEIGGHDGAGHLAEAVRARLGRDGTLAFVLDEGGFVIDGAVPGVAKPVAFVGNSEKGSVTAKLTVSTYPSCHSSQPNPRGESNIGILARAICKLEDRPHPVYIDEYVHRLKCLGPHLPFWLRLVVANTFLFGPLLKSIVLKKPATAASARTTTALTVLRSGAKINAIPGEASAWVNHRIHPRDTDGATVLRRDAAYIGDARVSIATTDDMNIPVAPVSPLAGLGYRTLKEVVYDTFDGAPVVPLIMIGNTDTRHYWGLSAHIYRFTPGLMHMDELGMFHGVNERLSAVRLAQLHAFYEKLLQKTVVDAQTEDT